MDYEKKIDELISKIEELNYHYYTLDQPLIADWEYDKIYSELIELEKKTGIIKSYSPSQRVGGQILDGFERHNHLGKLYSLDKAQSYDELRDWDIRVKNLIKSHEETSGERLNPLEYVLEYKFDGLTINLTYKDGLLVNGATRGNGIFGEEILEQVKTIRTIPSRIEFKGSMEVQGEGLMPLSALEKYNEKAEEPLKNARNAAAGALRNLDTSETRKRNLIGYFYNIGYIEDKEFKSHIEMLNFIRDERIPNHPYHKLFNSMDELIEEVEKQGEIRHNLDIQTDGMVIKINDIRTREVLGYTNKFPRWAIAYKYEDEEVVTRLIDVVWNVGRTSKVTPSAILEPVEIGGATITRATLNNIDDIRRKGLRLNSNVLLRRSNDVIPEILKALETREESWEIEMPSHCPACGTELIREGVHLFCPNSLSCKPQLVSRLVHFASRDGMDIVGFSEKTAEILLEELDLVDLPELYELRYEDIYGLEGFKDKKTRNLLEAIENSKKVSLASFIYALGIDQVGIRTANDLADHFKSLDKLRAGSYEELISIKDIGPKTASHITEFFSDDKIKESLEKLLSEGVEIFYEEKNIESSIFLGKNIVVTGSLTNYTRKEIKDKIEALGGNIRSSVSGNTDYLILGDKPGSKYERARELGIEVLDEERLKELLD